MNTLNAIVFELQVIYSSENLKIAIAQLCNEVQGLQYCYVIAEPKVGECHISKKFTKCNRFQVTSDLLK